MRLTCEIISCGSITKLDDPQCNWCYLLFIYVIFMSKEQKKFLRKEFQTQNAQGHLKDRQKLWPLSNSYFKPKVQDNTKLDVFRPIPNFSFDFAGSFKEKSSGKTMFSQKLSNLLAVQWKSQLKRSIQMWSPISQKCKLSAITLLPPPQIKTLIFYTNTFLHFWEKNLSNWKCFLPTIMCPS